MSSICVPSWFAAFRRNLGAAADVNIWATGNQWRWVPFCGAALLAAALFLLIVVVFIPLGQTVSRQMNAAQRPLSAYSWKSTGQPARDPRVFGN